MEEGRSLLVCVCTVHCALHCVGGEHKLWLWVNSGASDSYFLNHFLHSFIVEGILLDCVGDKLESGSEYRFIRSEDILNSHLKICSSISVPRRSSHRGDNDEDDNNEDDLLMDACSDQKGSGLVICLTRIQRHVSLSLSLSRPVHGLCWYCHVLRPCLWIWLLLCGVSFVFGLIFSWPVFMQRICNL